VRLGLTREWRSRPPTCRWARGRRLLRIREVLRMPLAILTIGCAAAVAWANGANDVSKGVATVVGSRLATYTQALRWGTLWTAAGAVTALLLTSTMVKTFSTGLVGSVGLSPVFPLAVSSGAFVWVLIASRTGLPVSTTHSLTGAIVGTGPNVRSSLGRERWPIRTAQAAGWFRIPKRR
jgi:PiT family inorganic phosphate transporter